VPMTAADIADVLEKGVRTLGIVVGGLWAYFKYFKGRIYRPRLELQALAKVIRSGEDRHLLVTAKLKNVGLSKVEVEQKGTAIRVLRWNPKSDAEGRILSVWDRIRTVSVFEHHHWTESGETIGDQKLFAVPPDSRVAFRVELRIVSRKKEWNVARVVAAEPPRAETHRSAPREVQNA
jgi:hypothetical protein